MLLRDTIKGNVPVVAGGMNCSAYHNASNTEAPVITISASGANAGFVNLWHVNVWSSDSSYIDNSMTSCVYFWYTLLKKRQKEIFDIQTGSAQPHIYPQHIEIMPINKISIADMEKYNKQVTPIYESIGCNTKQYDILNNLRDTILPKLMSGETEDVSSLNYHLTSILQSVIFLIYKFNNICIYLNNFPFITIIQGMKAIYYVSDIDFSNKLPLLHNYFYKMNLLGLFTLYYI